MAVPKKCYCADCVWRRTVDEGLAPCCDCGEGYPKDDLTVRGDIYCPDCRVKHVIHQQPFPKLGVAMTTLTNVTPPTPGLVFNDMTFLEWCEYDLGDGRVYRINDPKELVYRKGGSTHRVVDSKGIVHIVPGPGYRGCVVRQKPRVSTAPVQF
jgi:hypothetical protein